MTLSEHIINNCGGSLSIVGMAKNTGKTVTLNYLLGELQHCCKKIAITSIGIDGEGLDQVTSTTKPEIVFYDNMMFITSEKHYATRRLTSEILHISNYRTSLGRLITAQTKIAGKVLISGPADTATLQMVIANNKRLGADFTIVDGALSRLSLASPSVTDSMILATGAVVSAKISHVVRQTKYVYDMVQLPAVDNCIKSLLKQAGRGVWTIDKEMQLHKLEMRSALMASKELNEQRLQDTIYIYVSGALGDKFLESLRMQKSVKNVILVVQDFTKVFATPESYTAFVRKGGTLQVLYSTRLMAVTVNPTSPEGYVLNSKELCDALEDSLQLPVYDVMRLD